MEASEHPLIGGFEALAVGNEEPKGKEDAAEAASNDNSRYVHRRTERRNAELDALLNRTSLSSLGIHKASSSPRMGGRAASPSAAQPAAADDEFIRHEIRGSDTLQGLAMMYNCPVSEIKRINGLWSDRDLYARRFLNVPNGVHSSPARSRSKLREADIDRFVEVAHCDRGVADWYLNEASWVFSRALENYYKEQQQQRVAPTQLPKRTEEAEQKAEKKEDDMLLVDLSIDLNSSGPAAPTPYFDVRARQLRESTQAALDQAESDMIGDLL